MTVASDADPSTTALGPLDQDHARVLLFESVRTLGAALFEGTVRYPDPRRFEGPLALPGATFVTYEHGDELVGCIGSVEAQRALVLDAARNSLLAAFNDPRTPGLRAYPVRGTSMKISVLYGFAPLEVATFDELAEAVRPGVDGLLLSSGNITKATLLPSVWEKVSSVQEFLEVLWRKAGFDPGAFAPDTEIVRYSAQEVSHPDLAALLSEAGYASGQM